MAKYSYHRKDANEPIVRAAFEALGCRYQKINEPVDALVAIPTGDGFINVLVEIKVPKVKPRKDQQKQQDFIASWPGPIHLTRTPEEAAAVVQRYKFKRPA